MSTVSKFLSQSKRSGGEKLWWGLEPVAGVCVKEFTLAWMLIKHCHSPLGCRHRASTSQHLRTCWLFTWTVFHVHALLNKVFIHANLYSQFPVYFILNMQLLKCVPTTAGRNVLFSSGILIGINRVTGMYLEWGSRHKHFKQGPWNHFGPGVEYLFITSGNVYCCIQLILIMDMKPEINKL